MAFFKRLGKWLQAVGSDAISRRYAVQSLFGASFRLGLSKFGSVYLTYHPDSYFVFKAHPEFDDLFIRFTKNNRSNNGGDIVRLWAFILNIKQVISEKIPGDFAELGVWRGNSAAILAQIAAASDRNLFLFDTFEGFDARDLRGIDTAKDVDFSATSIELVH